MRHKPNHICLTRECPGCAFELGEQSARNKPKKSAKYVWMVVGSDNPCDIRRYAHSHEEAVAQLAHAKKSKYKDAFTGGVWTLFKLVQVSKASSK